MAKKRGAGEGSIFQRKDGRWSAVVTTGYENGRRKRKTYYGQTRKDVADQLTGALNDQKEGRPIPTGRQTVAEFLDSWLADCVKPHKAIRTYLSYSEQVRLHIGPALGHLWLRKLTGQRVQAFLNGLKLSPRTVQYNRTILRCALKQAVLWKLIPHNPAADGITTAKVKQRKVEAVTVEHARAILGAVAGHRLAPLFTLMLFTGLRRGEALGLSWVDVDIDKRTLTVRQQLQRIPGESVDGERVPGKLELSEPKTEQSRRTITLPKAVVDALKSMRTRQLEERMKLGQAWQDTGLVFVTELGTALEPRNVKRALDGLLKDAGLPHMRLHDQRHACATLLLTQGEDLKTISTVLGHSSISVTADVYAHVSQSLIQGAMDKLDKAIGSK
jgi:integrase